MNHEINIIPEHEYGKCFYLFFGRDGKLHPTDKGYNGNIFVEAGKTYQIAWYEGPEPSEIYNLGRFREFFHVTAESVADYWVNWDPGNPHWFRIYYVQFSLDATKKHLIKKVVDGPQAGRYKCSIDGLEKIA